MYELAPSAPAGVLAWSFFKAFLVALAVTPILRDVFRAYHIVDRPTMRKLHAYPVPRLGGIALLAAYLTGLLGLHSGVTWQLLPATAVIFMTGILDDFFDLPARLKLVGQAGAALLAYQSGLRIPGPASVSLPVTVFWLVLASNAFNLVDGLDGLCAGLGCTAACAFFVMAHMHGIWALDCAMVSLAAGLLGFLCHNFSRATIFLGDSGALLIGFLLGCGGVLWTQRTGPHLAMLAPVLVVWVPVLDLGLSIVRRWAVGRPIFSADRGHIHHRLLHRGLSAKETVLVLYAWGATGGVLAILLAYPPLHSWAALVLAGLLVLTLAGIRQLRYSEFKWRQM